MKTTAVLLILAAASACGIKGPPLPPLREETIQAQKPLTPQPATTTASQDRTKASQKKKK